MDARYARKGRNDDMANSGTIKVKVEPDLSEWDDALLDALAEKVAQKLAARTPYIQAPWYQPYYPNQYQPMPYQIWCSTATFGGGIQA